MSDENEILKAPSKPKKKEIVISDKLKDAHHTVEFLPEMTRVMAELKQAMETREYRTAYQKLGALRSASEKLRTSLQQSARFTGVNLFGHCDDEDDDEE